MRAEILSIGTELLMGEIVDTNAAYTASRLPALGIELRQVTQLPDDLPRLTEAFCTALGRSDLTLATGGLGPTQDDLTREAIAGALGETMTVDKALLEELERYFQQRGIVPMPAINAKQAMVIPSAQALRNPRGTAPGWWVEKGGRIIVALPGVPQELEYLWESHVAPRLKKLSHGAVVLSRTIKTFGLSEAAVAERVADLFGNENPYLGIYAKSDGIHLRIIARAATEEEAWRLVRPMEEELRRALKDVIWGVDTEQPEEMAGVLLRQQRLTLATMESCTGGLLASAITDVPGSSDYFRGGIVTYATEAKVGYGVDRKLVEAHGVISAQVAEAMAQAARRELTADIGIGLTGVAGPATVEGKPVGTVFIGLAWDGGTRSISGRYPPQRHLVKRRAVTHALLELCRLLLQRDRG